MSEEDTKLDWLSTQNDGRGDPETGPQPAQNVAARHMWDVMRANSDPCRIAPPRRAWPLMFEASLSQVLKERCRPNHGPDRENSSRRSK